MHDFLGFKKPLHPLITVIREWPEIDFDFSNVKMTSDLYVISLKGKLPSSMTYGRNTYDYQEGTLTFMAPNQVFAFDGPKEQVEEGGWTISFHSDLLRRSRLGEEISKYAFFDYDVHEALHVSDKEKSLLATFVQNIELELNQNIDKHSQELIIANVDSLLKYCERYYQRQFFTRTNLNKDHVTRFEKYLKTYFDAENLAEKGIPSVGDCGKSLNMSGSYLSELLKVETGRSAKDHIHDCIIHRAKNILLNSNASIGEVAYGLGFEYPQHFSTLFKSKTGLNPTDYRSNNSLN